MHSLTKLWAQSLWVSVSHSAMSNSLWPHELWPIGLLCLWNPWGKTTGMGCHFLLQGIFPAQESNLGLLHWQADAGPLSHLGNQKCDVSISVQLLSPVWLFATPWTAARQASLSIINSRRPPKPMSIGPVIPSSYLILCHPFHLLPSIFPSIRVISNESALPIRWPKYWSFSFNISPSNEHPGLISFRMDWLDLLAVQGTSPAPQFKSINSTHSYICVCT